MIAIIFDLVSLLGEAALSLLLSWAFIPPFVPTCKSFCLNDKTLSSIITCNIHDIFIEICSFELAVVTLHPQKSIFDIIQYKLLYHQNTKTRHNLLQLNSQKAQNLLILGFFKHCA